MAIDEQRGKQMSEHVLVLEIDDGHVRGSVVCREPADAQCQTTPKCKCEEWDELLRDDKGWFHYYEEDIPDSLSTRQVKHRHEPADECNICNWLNQEDSLEFMEEGKATAEIPIKPVWLPGGYMWKPLS